ncbi:MAG: preprotein translocase subunit SecG [Pseudomonadota bacterium]
MSTVLLVILLILSVIMTGLILIQRSEGGALGIGGGGGGGGGTGFMSGRAATTSVARMTAILGTVFLVLSLLLSVVFALENQETGALDNVDNEVGGLTSPIESSDGTTPLDEPADVPAAPADPSDTDE